LFLIQIDIFVPCAEYSLSAEYSAAFSCRIFVFGLNKKICFRSITSSNCQAQAQAQALKHRLKYWVQKEHSKKSQWKENRLKRKAKGGEWVARWRDTNIRNQNCIMLRTLTCIIQV
jgi:hypothetical protein